MAPQTMTLNIASFGPKKFAGNPGKDAGTLFIGAGFATFLACLLLMIFIPPLQNVGVVIIICTLSAITITVWDIVSTIRREKRYLTGLTETVNDFIVESTGDRSSRITVTRLRQLIDFGGKLPLSMNGVPCLDLTVGGQRFGSRVVIATVTAPDYGLESFDRLLREEEQRKD
jgi:hypothetical protein